MTDIIGPSFGSQVHAAGLAGLPFSWSAQGVTYGDGLTAEQRSAIEALVAAHDPTAGTLSDLAAVKASRIAALSAACAAAILGGYLSDALGNPHTYPSGITDQINMMGSVTASLLPGTQANWATPFWCRDAEGIWAFRLHSAVQFQQAGADGKAHVVICQAQLEALNAQVMAAETVDEVQAVVWRHQ